MKVDFMEFRTTKRFRVYAIWYKSHWYSPWRLVEDSNGTVLLFSEKERDEKVKELMGDGEV